MRNLLLLISGVVFSLLVTGCSHLAEYKVPVFNIGLVKKTNEMSVPKGVYSAIYGDNINDVYFFYGSAFGEGEEDKALAYEFQFDRAAVIYSSLKYGKANGYKYITFVIPADSSSMVLLSEITEDEEKYLRNILSNKTMTLRTEIGYSKYKFELDKGDAEPIEKRDHKIAVMFFKEQPLKYRTFKISKVLNVMDNYYGLKGSKIFNVGPITKGKENGPYTNFGSQEADLKKVNVIKG